jgi:hypothetical protein
MSFATTLSARHPCLADRGLDSLCAMDVLAPKGSVRIDAHFVIPGRDSRALVLQESHERMPA